jgi:uncharacterized cupin superfamily protein
MTAIKVPHLNVHNPHWKPLPEYGGHKAILYESDDGSRVAATFRESGKFTFEYPFDELVYVVEGSLTATVHGGETIDLVKGDVAYFREGMIVDFDMSADFQDVTCLMSRGPVRY